MAKLKIMNEHGECRYVEKIEGGKHQCSIYDSRPKECHIKEDFQLNADCCNGLQLLFGIDEPFRVVLPSQGTE